MGQAHNLPDATGTGTRASALGYREASSTGFFTIVALPMANSGQFGINDFGNPAVLHAGTGRPTANANAKANNGPAFSCPGRWSRCSVPSCRPRHRSSAMASRRPEAFRAMTT